jgi:hypothetical protein
MHPRCQQYQNRKDFVDFRSECSNEIRHRKNIKIGILTKGNSCNTCPFGSFAPKPRAGNILSLWRAKDLKSVQDTGCSRTCHSLG